MHFGDKWEERKERQLFFQYIWWWSKRAERESDNKRSMKTGTGQEFLVLLVCFNFISCLLVFNIGQNLCMSARYGERTNGEVKI